MISGCFAGSPAGCDAFGSWRGSAVQLAHAFAPQSYWTDVELPSGWLNYWGSTHYRDSLLLSLPLLPRRESGVTLTRCASGDYDGHFKTAAQRLKSVGMEPMVRLGWEMNQRWNTWSSVADPQAYVDAFRRVVKVMHSVTPDLKFVWCPAANPQNGDTRKAFPGSEYVDYVAVDQYDAWWGHGSVTPDQRWHYLLTGNGGLGGLRFWKDFANDNDTPFGVAEWGLTSKWAANGGGGGDDPLYIQRMRDWLVANAEWECYLNSDPNDGHHRLDNGQYPKASAKYKSLW